VAGMVYSVLLSCYNQLIAATSHNHAAAAAANACCSAAVMYHYCSLHCQPPLLRCLLVGPSVWQLLLLCWTLCVLAAVGHE
jgi:hypothetical protein